MQKKNFGFTLIELLIVVAIIAILAAIAIPNFLAAQTRAKVTRAKGEMRTLATALEAYYVDNSMYPDDLYIQDGAPWYIPSYITSPIAYITNGKLRDPMRPIGLYGGTAYERYRYLNFDVEASVYITNSEKAHWSNNRWPGWPSATYSANALQGRWQYGKWRIDSCGPDGTAGPYGGMTWKGATIPTYYSLMANNMVYDPTNGTVSMGDVMRSQKEADTKSQYDDITKMGKE
jgi:prepilin-type N-terminal cleavage/methylation domain-containing protein